jgi:hypothetical protein
MRSNASDVDTFIFDFDKTITQKHLHAQADTMYNAMHNTYPHPQNVPNWGPKDAKDLQKLWNFVKDNPPTGLAQEWKNIFETLLSKNKIVGIATKSSYAPLVERYLFEVIGVDPKYRNQIKIYANLTDKNDHKLNHVDVITTGRRLNAAERKEQYKRVCFVDDDMKNSKAIQAAGGNVIEGIEPGSDKNPFIIKSELNQKYGIEFPENKSQNTANKKNNDWEWGYDNNLAIQDVAKYEQKPVIKQPQVNVNSNAAPQTNFSNSPKPQSYTRPSAAPVNRKYGPNGERIFGYNVDIETYKKTVKEVCDYLNNTVISDYISRAEKESYSPASKSQQKFEAAKQVEKEIGKIKEWLKEPNKSQKHIDENLDNLKASLAELAKTSQAKHEGKFHKVTKFFKKSQSDVQAQAENALAMMNKLYPSDKKPEPKQTEAQPTTPRMRR